MTDEAATAPALQLAAQALQESAAEHKALAMHHRRQARQKARQLDELRARCAEFGITIHIVRTDIAREAQS